MTTPGSTIFVARLLGLDVFDPQGDRIGRLRDVVLVNRSQPRPPAVIGLVVEVPGKKRIFVPMTRVTAIDTAQIITSGLINLRRFEQRGAEQLVVADLFDRRVTMRDGSGDATIEDIGIQVSRSGDWTAVELYVRRAPQGARLSLRRGERLVVDWNEALQGSAIEPQGATHFVATHEDLNPADFADALHEMPEKRRLEVAAELQDERLADVLQELPDDHQVEILTSFDAERAAHVLEEMDPDDAADLLNELPDDQKEALLGLMEPEEAKDVRRLLSYEEGTAGSIMTPLPVIVGPQATVAEALAMVRREEHSPALASLVCVARPPLETPTGRYIGVVHIQQLLRSAPPEQLGNLVDSTLEPISDLAALSEVARNLATYNLTAIPVVNDANRLVGLVTIDDLLDHLLPEDWREHTDEEISS
ncbi:magnesium transporter MgtE N-terminal domain-containing protein [Falsarthrobacter nasiphocae]|uniref:CBS domain-containing protein/sporulation protein YlmC with PRC-barrel domain/DNA-directed RNA polymerase specialized sigma24 family protein n=1 Tax=Falsarthrobacter nasiphocae TaxID=189863 RepID=A0AAE4C6G8_9MICC|nr:CBS domain-containing protein [Falsarthrobacter nasiphocae]MDR6891474.1 CBS domain-containing protein/sporulation protein YlmC with PRC-barrel domain/DNA-directed RNA polymerase specialized sigma24 family protein [Falsarthrobacter nasiphocae]